MLPEATSVTALASIGLDAEPVASRIEPAAAVRNTSPEAVMPPMRTSPSSCLSAMRPAFARAFVLPVTAWRTKPVAAPFAENVPIEPLPASSAALRARMFVSSTRAWMPRDAVTDSVPLVAASLPSWASPSTARLTSPAVDVAAVMRKTSSSAEPLTVRPPAAAPVNEPFSLRETRTAEVVCPTSPVEELIDTFVARMMAPALPLSVIKPEATTLAVWPARIWS